MAQPLSVENNGWVYLITTRTADSKLWFVNNKELELLILAALARYMMKYGVIVYGFILMGNHYHLLASFPNCNRALFMRDFNSAVARLVGRHVKTHGRRSVWARRYSYQVLARPEDVRHWFFYLALNPVSSGLTKSINEYPGYNSFHDAINGTVRTYKWIDWSAFLMKERYDESLKPEDFEISYELKYSRLPDEENQPAENYKVDTLNELERRQTELVKERLQEGKGFLGLKKILAQSPGTSPVSTKISSRWSIRPLILTLCAETKKKFLKVYFDIKAAYMEASEAFISGNLNVSFPEGTYPPPRLVVSS